MTSLPTLVPAPTDTTTYRPLVGDTFQYALNIDQRRWDDWTYSVEVDTYFYNVSATDTQNARLFSEFLIYFKCNTVQDKDACCVTSENDGTLCLIPTTTGTVMQTFRFTKGEWQDTVIAPGQADSDSSGGFNGADYWFRMDSLKANGFAPVGYGRDNWNNYQDALNCAYTTTNVAYQFTCVGWQVHYDWNTHRFARYGKDEKLWFGFIDATQTTEY